MNFKQTRIVFVKLMSLYGVQVGEGGAEGVVGKGERGDVITGRECQVNSSEGRRL